MKNIGEVTALALVAAKMLSDYERPSISTRYGGPIYFPKRSEKIKAKKRKK